MAPSSSQILLLREKKVEMENVACRAAVQTRLKPCEQLFFPNQMFLIPNLPLQKLTSRSNSQLRQTWEMTN